MVSRYIEPLVWRIENREAIQAYQDLKADMTASRRNIDSMVDQKLGQLLEYIVKNVPFYQREELCWAVAKLPPKEALIYFPVLFKTDIQRLGDKLLGTDRQGAKANNSGGSTGHILNFFQSPTHFVHAAAGRRLGYMLTGWKPGQPIVFFWGNPADFHPGRKKWIGLLRNKIYQVKWYNAFAPDEQMLERVIQCLSRRHALLVGYASSLGHLALYLKKCGRTVPTLGVQATADTLTDGLRQLLENVFQSEVFNRYGSRELSIVAHEWYDHGGMYVFERNNYVEILDDDGRLCKPGRIGRIVVTNLNNYAMPFIRYDIGDVGYWYIGDQKPASQLLRFGNVIGRENDLIYGPSGTAVYCEFFARLFYSKPGVEQFQVIQDDKAHLAIKILAIPDVDRNSLLDYLRTMIHHHADPGFRIDFEFVSEIPTTASGKRRYVYRTWKT